MDSVLLVDDENDNLQALHRLLRQEFQVTTTTSPFEALKLLQKQNFHVLVTDQRMPEMTGVDLLEKARSIRPETTRVLLTGYTDIQSVIASINRGHVYRYIAKPWDPEEFKVTLRQANEFYHLRNALQLKNEALARSLEDLQKLDKAKARFLALISHELNTPLTVLTSFFQLLKSNEAQMPPEMKKSVTAMGGAVDRFSEIIAEVITFVRVESQSTRPKESFDLVKETENIKSALRSQLSEKKLTLSVQAPATAKTFCDAEKMHIALTKLIEDCALRAPEKSTIEVHISSGDDGILYRLARQGEVLGEDAFASLQTSEKILNHQKNLGLKLSIGKLIVEESGGSISVDKTAKQGAAFTLHLPAATNA